MVGYSRLLQPYLVLLAYAGLLRSCSWQCIMNRASLGIWCSIWRGAAGGLGGQSSRDALDYLPGGGPRHGADLGALLYALHVEATALRLCRYVALVATAFIAKAVSLQLWGNVASRRGARFLLWLGGISIVPLASLWTLGQSFAWVMCVQILSGTFWAAYELGFFLMFFESMPVRAASADVDSL